MTESLYHKLLVHRNRSIADMERSHSKIISLSGILQRELIQKSRRKRDIIPEIESLTYYVYVKYRLPKMDIKFIHITGETIFDLAGIDFVKVDETQTQSWFCYKYGILDVTFYFSEECIPIKEEETITREVIKGYRCQ